MLADLDALTSLVHIGVRLDIQSNPRLSNIEGLTSLGYSSTVEIDSNDALTDLDGLPSLSQLYVRGNDALTDITGLSNLVSVGGPMTLTGNSRLCRIAVDAFIAGCSCGHPVTATGNAPGC